MTELNINSHIGNMTEINLNNTSITELDLRNMKLLQSVSAKNAKLSGEININNSPKLKYINMSNNNISSVNIANRDKLETVYLNNNQITTMNLSNMKKYASVNLSNNRLASVNLAGNSKGFSSLVLYNNYLSQKPSECTKIGSRCNFGYILTYNTNGAGSIPSQNGVVMEKPEDPSKSGYVFGGWYTDSGFNNTFNFNKGLSKNTTIYAKWVDPSQANNPSEKPSTSKPTGTPTGPRTSSSGRDSKMSGSTSKPNMKYKDVARDDEFISIKWIASIVTFAVGILGFSYYYVKKIKKQK